MTDVLIKGGIVVDGSGAPGRSADVTIRDGRVAAIGAADAPAQQTIDATGRIVAPGFIDLHTHYDAQAFWDPTLSPSPLHGVTTVIGGNCGFSIAPLVPSASGYLMRMLARVEGMPLASLATGVPWNWTSFAGYLDALDGTLAVNAGFLVGHSAIRRAVMGDGAIGHAADAGQTAAMVGLLHESLAAGGMGFSSSWSVTHNDGEGEAVPSRHATRDELLALCSAVRDHEGTSLEFIPGVGKFDDAQIDIMTAMSAAARRTLNWNVLQINSYNPEIARNQLRASDHARDNGGHVVALTLPMVMNMRLNLLSGFIFDALPGWARVIGLPLAQRMTAFANADLRRELDEKANSPEAGLFRFFANWERLVVDQVALPENEAFKGRTVGDIATEQGKRPLDAMLDLALAEGLRTSFMPPMPGDDDESWKLRNELWHDDRTIIGASDAGAHLDMIDTFAYSTTLLGRAVREKKLLTIEDAVHQLTERPATLYGLRDRGRLEVGAAADIVVFDPATVGPGPVHTRNDLPGGAARLYAEAEGIGHVLVNGVEIVRGGEFTGARPGTVLRSGRDSRTTGIGFSG